MRIQMINIPITEETIAKSRRTKLQKKEQQKKKKRKREKQQMELGKTRKVRFKQGSVSQNLKYFN